MFCFFLFDFSANFYQQRIGKRSLFYLNFSWVFSLVCSHNALSHLNPLPLVCTVILLPLYQKDNMSAITTF